VAALTVKVAMPEALTPQLLVTTQRYCEPDSDRAAFAIKYVINIDPRAGGTAALLPLIGSGIGRNGKVDGAIHADRNILWGGANDRSRPLRNYKEQICCLRANSSRCSHQGNGVGPGNKLMGIA